MLTSIYVCIYFPFVKLVTLLMSLCVSAGQFSRQEEKRQKAERLHQQQKHENQQRAKTSECEGNTRELQQLQVSRPLHAALIDLCRTHQMMFGPSSSGVSGQPKDIHDCVRIYFK